MKIRSLFLASALVLTAGAAMAQTTPSANNPTAQAGSKASDTTMSKETMSKDTMAHDKMKSTTGMDNKNVSPASPAAGEKQQK